MQLGGGKSAEHVEQIPGFFLLYLSSFDQGGILEVSESCLP